MTLRIRVVAAYKSCHDLSILHSYIMDLVLGAEEGDEELVGPVLNSLDWVIEAG